MGIWFENQNACEMVEKIMQKEDGWGYFIYFMKVFLQQGKILRLLHSCRASHTFVEVKHEKIKPFNAVLGCI